MSRAILFWFYKDLKVCENRLKLLRRHHRNTKIFGLYGGDAEYRDRFRERLAPYLDDYFSDESNQTSQWKWENGDLMIADWYRKRGHELEWTSLFIAQWDMLVMGPIQQIFADVPDDRLLLSGLRSIEREGQDWYWIATDANAARYQTFLQHVRHTYGYDGDPLFCIFIVAILTRHFLERYANVREPELGFLEYRLPIYAQIFGIECHPSLGFELSPPGENRSDVVLTVKEPISYFNVIRNLRRSNGSRLFHPYHEAYPLTIAGHVLVSMRVGSEPFRGWCRGQLERHVLWRFKRNSGNE